MTMPLRNLDGLGPNIPILDVQQDSVPAPEKKNFVVGETIRIRFKEGDGVTLQVQRIYDQCSAPYDFEVCGSVNYGGAICTAILRHKIKDGWKFFQITKPTSQAFDITASI